MRNFAIAAALGAAALAIPAAAQTVTFSGGLVNIPVTVSDVSVLDQSNFLNDNQIQALNNLVTAGNVNVQVPIGIAAQVCGVTANVLAAQRAGGAPVDCTNRTMSQAFANQIARQFPTVRAAR
jgi:hypothetical protein